MLTHNSPSQAASRPFCARSQIQRKEIFASRQAGDGFLVTWWHLGQGHGDQPLRPEPLVIMPGTSPHPQLPIPEEMQRHLQGWCWRGRIWMELNGYELIWAWTCCISYIEEATWFRSRFNSRGINKGNGLKHHYYFSSFLASCRLAKPFAKSKCSLFCRRCKGTLAFVHALCYCRRAEMPTASHECSFSELMNSATCQQSTGRMKMSMMLND